MRGAAAERSRPVIARALVWLLLSMPAGWIAYRWAAAPERYGYGHAIGDSGDWAAWLLIAALAVTPLRLVFARSGWTARLLRYRRDLGVASFAYAVGHTAIYLWDKRSPALVLEEAAMPGMLFGWLALALFAPLAATSNDRAMRAMKRAWKRLHRLVYPAAILTFLHWALTAYDSTTALLYAAGLAALETVRIVLQRRQRVT